MTLGTASVPRDGPRGGSGAGAAVATCDRVEAFVEGGNAASEWGSRPSVQAGPLDGRASDGAVEMGDLGRGWGWFSASLI